MADHYGSLYTMADFENKVHNVYFSASTMATDRLNLFGTVTYNLAEGSLEEVLMPDPEPILGDHLENQDFEFHNMHTYSNVDFEYLKLDLGFNLKLTETMSWFNEGSYIDLKDNAGYVYGIETGSYVTFRSGFKIDL